MRHGQPFHSGRKWHRGVSQNSRRLGKRDAEGFYNPSASGIRRMRSGLVWAGMLMVTN